MLTIALICISHFLSIANADCSIPPIYLDIQARKVEGQNDATSYGMSINFGTPAQQLSLWPSLQINKTALADASFCSTSCSPGTADGFFIPGKSASFQNTTLPQLDNASVLTNADSTVAEAGTDILHLRSDLIADETLPETNISSFPLQLLSNYTSSDDPFFSPAGLVGLGPSSTLLEYLFKAGKIASRSYGLVLGTAYPGNSGIIGVNGSLTLGGYDAARFTAPVHSFPLITKAASLSPFKLRLSGLTPTDTTTSPALEIPANNDIYLSTAQYETVLPSSLANPLASALQTTITNNTLDLPSSSHLSTKTNLTFHFGSNNASITLPLSSISSSSSIKFSPTPPYTFGASFLSQIYLIVSYDSNLPSFYLAPALRDAPFVSLKTLCPDSDEAPVALAQTTPHLSFFMRNGLIGLVLGVGLGGSAVGLVVVVVVMSWRRGRQNERRQIGRCVNLTRKGIGEEVEMGTVTKTKAGVVGVVEVTDKDVTSMAWDQKSAAVHFDPPPRRETVAADGKKERRLGRKSVMVHGAGAF